MAPNTSSFSTTASSSASTSSTKHQRLPAPPSLPAPLVPLASSCGAGVAAAQRGAIPGAGAGRDSGQARRTVGRSGRRAPALAARCAAARPRQERPAWLGRRAQGDDRRRAREAGPTTRTAPAAPPFLFPPRHQPLLFFSNSKPPPPRASPGHRGPAPPHVKPFPPVEKAARSRC
jgi:hypothetical protein